MNKFQSFQEFLAQGSVQVPVVAFLINLLLAGILAYILHRVYVRYGTSLSNRLQFGRNFILLTMTTMLIISIVKSSLALSLGLVGALSIVRFRAAIKEPEELAYLFLAIAIGLGLGANQTITTLVAFVVIVGVLIGHRMIVRSSDDKHNLHLTLQTSQPKQTKLETIVKTLKANCKAVNLKRFDETSDGLEASFLVEFDSFDQLNRAKTALQGLDNTIKISFLDNRGII